MNRRPPIDWRGHQRATSFRSSWGSDHLGAGADERYDTLVVGATAAHGRGNLTHWATRCASYHTTASMRSSWTRPARPVRCCCAKPGDSASSATPAPTIDWGASSLASLAARRPGTATPQPGVVDEVGEWTSTSVIDPRTTSLPAPSPTSSLIDDDQRCRIELDNFCRG